MFGPHPRSYEQRLPRKMKRLALRGALTAKYGDEAIKVVDAFGLEQIRTKDFVGVLGALEAQGRVLVVAPARDQALELSAPQPAEVEVILADCLNVVDLLEADASHRAAGPRPDGSRLRRRRQRPRGGVPRERLTAHEIILRPVISEKSIDESGRGKYTFAVHDNANKIQIKAAVEELYKQ